MGCAEFSPDGSRLAVPFNNGTVGIWDFPSSPAGAPPWFPGFLNMVADRCSAYNGLPPTNRSPSWDTIGKALAGQASRDLCARMACWFLFPHERTTIAPASALSISNHVENLLRFKSVRFCEEAIRWNPADSRPWSVAAGLLAQGGTLLGQAEADLFSERAILLAPDSPEAWRHRAEVLSELGQSSKAWDGVQEALRRFPDDPLLREVEAGLLAGKGALNEALDAYSHALGLTSNRESTQRLMAARGKVLLNLGRTSEARRDQLASLITERAPGTVSNLLELSAVYNRAFVEDSVTGAEGNNLAELETGVVELAGVRWDLRAMVQLKGNEDSVSTAGMPQRSEGIRVAQTCRRLNLLHGTGMKDQEGTEIGRLILHFANGEVRALSIRYGVHVRDWWHGDLGDAEDKVPGSVVAWTGQNVATRAWNRAGTHVELRLFKTTWENPLPTVEITSLDYVSALGKCAPFLIAVTLDP